MSDTSKAAWIGVAGTLAGAVITLVAQPILTEKLGPKREGLFTVEQTCLSGRNLDPTVASQVTSFPCQLRVAHIEGPAITKLSVTLSSKQPLAEVKPDRNDENAMPLLTSNASVLTLDVPTLRQGSIVDVRFVSKGEPSIEKSIVRESGALLTDVPSKPSDSWLDRWYGVPLLIVGFALLAAGVAYFLYARLLIPAVGPLPGSKLVVAGTIAILAMVPILDLGSLIQTVLLLAILHLVSDKKFP